ncbi:unnamed protein product [Linum tenue]|uniref:EF-hand domain-containing protein n=1 Tax=Linum tenue TaxID=586396 RepID=A0AAV0LTD9_9ROSI|nr:unnamed protein product [Linum tenue]
MDDLFHSCDFDGSGGIQFNEFIVLQASNMGSPELEATFDTIVEAFLFLDKNEEMDRDRNGKVGFREFLFALIQWVGIEADDEEE